MKPLFINEIFTSVDGEVTGHGQGGATVFVRLQGCNLRCPYCDTPDALAIWSEDASCMAYKPDKLIERLSGDFEPLNRITITGGEPMLQSEAVFDFLSLLPKKTKVTIETNGTYPAMIFPKNLRKNVSLVYDYKMYRDRRLLNFDHRQRIVVLSELASKFYFGLKSKDFIKFVCENPDDFSLALDFVSAINHFAWCSASFAFGIVEQSKTEEFNEKYMLDRIRWNRIDRAFINVQLHKLLKLK